jgi:hypothetical protein
MQKFMAIAAATLICAGSVWAQSTPGPSEKFGLGATIANPNTEVALGSVQGQYALSKDLHIGLGLGLEFADKGTFISLIPFAKYLFPSMGGFRPYVLGQLPVQRTGTENFAGNSEHDTRVSLVAGVGAEYFVTNSFGVFVNVPALVLPFRSGGAVSFGVLTPNIGVEFFMD